MSLTTDPAHPDLHRGADNTPVDQAKVYLVLDDKEIAKGYIRPFRKTYWHLTCAAPTTMASSIASTYASDPWFYGGAYCATCRMHRDHNEFVWEDPARGIGGGVDQAWINANSLDPLLWPEELYKEVGDAKVARKEARSAAGKPGQYWRTAKAPVKPYEFHYPVRVELIENNQTIRATYADGSYQDTAAYCKTR